MYCGDETGAFIGDIGSHSSRFGYGGEDNPKYVAPSYVAGGKADERYVPTTSYVPHEDLTPIYRQVKASSPHLPQTDPNQFMQQGDVVEDWDAYEAMWQRAFDVLRVRDTVKHTKGGQPYERAKVSGIDSSKLKSSDNNNSTRSSTGDGKCPHPILAVTSGMTHEMGTEYDKKIHQEQLRMQTEIIMEGLEATSCFLAPTPMLSAFSHGRQTCVVADVGAGGTRVTPVVDGLLLKHSQRRSGRGGDWLGNIQWKALLEEKINPLPRYQLRNKTRKSLSRDNPHFVRWAMHDLMYEVRTACPSVSQLEPWRTKGYTVPFVDDDQPMHDSSSESSTEISHYELPDGTTVDLSDSAVGQDLRRLPELLFTDEIPFRSDKDHPEEYLVGQHKTLSGQPIHRLIHSSITSAGDADLRKELCGAILLCGASSLYPNMDQRLSYELSTIVSANFKCRVVASRHTVERSCAAWVGGSILTSLGSFQQLWLSKTEYNEYGASLASQRFPC